MLVFLSGACVGTEDEGRPGFFGQRLVPPLRSLLAQGLTPDALALSLAVGMTLGLFPIIGATTLLCLAAGLAYALVIADMLDRMRVNQERLLYYQRKALYARATQHESQPVERE